MLVIKFELKAQQCAQIKQTFFKKKGSVFKGLDQFERLFRSRFTVKHWQKERRNKIRVFTESWRGGNLNEQERNTEKSGVCK